MFRHILIAFKGSPAKELGEVIGLAKNRSEAIELVEKFFSDKKNKDFKRVEAYQGKQPCKRWSVPAPLTKDQKEKIKRAKDQAKDAKAASQKIKDDSIQEAKDSEDAKAKIESDKKADLEKVKKYGKSLSTVINERLAKEAEELAAKEAKEAKEAKAAKEKALKDKE